MTCIGICMGMLGTPVAGAAGAAGAGRGVLSICRRTVALRSGSPAMLITRPSIRPVPGAEVLCVVGGGGTGARTATDGCAESVVMQAARMPSLKLTTILMIDADW